MKRLHSAAMSRALPAVALAAVLCAAGCREREAPRAAPADAPGVEALKDDGPREAHSADRLGAIAEHGVKVSPELVERYIDYRRKVVERGREAVTKFRKLSLSEQEAHVQAASVRAVRATEEFAVRMRAIEESARKDSGMSREEVLAVGQVAAEVLTARQIWKMSGGDGSPEYAKARSEADARGVAEMREARSARTRFGDAAVDAVLAREEALWKVQQDGARVMADVY